MTTFLRTPTTHASTFSPSRRRPDRCASAFLGLLLLGAALVSSGCSGESAPDDSLTFVADQTYTDLPGTIKVLPNPARPIDDFAIAHEHIPEFRGEDGEIFINSDGTPGMKAMTMPFNLAPGISIEGFNVGDRVRFGFEVDWDGDPRYRIHEIELQPDRDAESSDQDSGG
jgi:hypothetical protein